MDFPNERYVRLYTRDTMTWKLLSWQSRCVLVLLLRKLDRTGLLELEGLHPVDAVKLVTELPDDVVAEGLPPLFDRGILEHRDGALLSPRFLEGQECAKSDAGRARAYREKRRSQHSLEPSQNVTHASRNVTVPSRPTVTRHEASQTVTLRHATPRQPTPTYRARDSGKKPLPEPPEDFREDDPEPGHDELADEIILTWKRSQPDGGVCARETSTVTRSASELASALRLSLRGHDSPQRAFQAAWRAFSDDAFWKGKNLPIQGLLSQLDRFHVEDESKRPKLEMYREVVDPTAKWREENARAEAAHQARLAAMTPEARAELERAEQRALEALTSSCSAAELKPAPAKRAAYRPKSADELASRREVLRQQQEEILRKKATGELT